MTSHGKTHPCNKHVSAHYIPDSVQGSAMNKNIPVLMELTFSLGRQRTTKQAYSLELGSNSALRAGEKIKQDMRKNNGRE